MSIRKKSMELVGSKPMQESTTIRSAWMSIATGIGGLFVLFAPETATGLEDKIAQIGSAITLVLYGLWTWYGRVRATDRIL